MKCWGQTKNENAQQIDEDKDEYENNPKDNINQGGGNDLDDMQDEVKELTHPQVKESWIRYELETNLNSEYFTPKHATRWSTDNQ